MSSSLSSHLPSSSADVDAYDQVVPSNNKRSRYIPGVSAVEIKSVNESIGRLIEKINGHPNVSRVKFYDDGHERNQMMRVFFAQLLNRDPEQVSATLKVCDFVITLDNKPLFAYERKTLNDLVGSISSGHAREQNTNMKFMAKMYHMNRKYVHWLIEFDDPSKENNQKLHMYDNDHLGRDAVEGFITHRLHLDGFEVVTTYGVEGTVYKLLKDMYFILEYIEPFTRYMSSLNLKDVPDYFDPNMPGIFDQLDTWDEVTDFISSRQDVPKITSDDSLKDALQELKLNERQLITAQMLQVIPGITAPYALLILQQYPSLAKISQFLLENSDNAQEVVDDLSQETPPPTWKQSKVQRMGPGRVAKIFNTFFAENDPIKVKAGKNKDKVIVEE